MQKQTNGATKFSAKETALIAEANAKAEAKGKVTRRTDIAEKANTARTTKINGGKPVVTPTDTEVLVAVNTVLAKATKTPTPLQRGNAQRKAEKAEQQARVTKVPAAPAAHATEKAPHTKRALEQNKLADKVSAANDKLTAAKAALVAAEAATKTVKRNDPQRDAKFLAKAQAEADLLAAQKAVLALKREAETPEERAARQAKQPTKTVRTPKAATNHSIAKGKVEYSNAKGGWTLYMVQLALAHKDTDSATAAHKAGAAKAGQNASKPLDFKWMHAKGYIVLG